MIPEVNAALVFTNPRVEINIDQEDAPTAENIPVGKLKDLVRKYAKSNPLKTEFADLINKKLAG